MARTAGERLANRFPGIPQPLGELVIQKWDKVQTDVLTIVPEKNSDMPQREVLTMTEVRSRFEQAGVHAVPSTPAELTARLVADIKKWSEVAARAGIQRK